MTTHTQKTRARILYASAILALLLAVIAAIVWKDSQRSQRIATAASSLRNDVNRLRIVRPGQPELRLSQVSGIWRITTPCDAAVNQQRLDPLLTLVVPSVHSYGAGEVDLDAAGLVKPQSSLYFNDTRVDIGNTDLSGERRYIKRQNRVEFAPEWVLSLVSGGLSAFVDPRIFALPLASISITAKGAVSGSVQGVLTDWQALEAQQIIALPLPGNDIALDAWQLDATTTDNTPVQMMLYRYASFAAFITENSECAFLLPVEALPSALPSR